MEQGKSVEVAGWEEVERVEELLKNAETVKVSGIDDEQCLALVGKLLACPNLKQLDFSANKKLDSLTILKAIEMVSQTRKYRGLAPCETNFATFDLQSMIDEARKGIDLPEDWNAENEAWYAPLVVLTDHLRANRANLAGNEASSRMELVMRVKLDLRLSKFKKEHPQVLSVPIEKPVFILGLFRSGTSLLFNLLSTDKAVRSPRLWELWNPLPPPKEETYETDERISQTQGILDHLFTSSLKGFEKIHFMKSDWPEECSHILRHLFVLGELSFSNCIPPYTEWLDQQSYEAVFKAHKEFLQVLSSDFAPKSHWLLKCPYHMWNIPELLQVYPDARFVWCHREPAESIASGMSLFSFVASKTYKSFDQVQEGPRMSEKLVEGLLKMTDHCTSGLINPFNIVHVNYKDLVSKPLDVVRQVYTHLNLPLTEATEQAAQAFLDANPKGKHGQHAYDLSEYGVSQDELNARLAPYFSAFFLQQ